MSQAGIASVTRAVPTIPTQFTTDSGIAVPAANNLNVFGSGSITTAGVGSTVTTQLTGLTNHAVLCGAGTSTITKLAVGTNGQVLIGSTGADPVFSTLTSSDSSITFTPGAGTLSLQVTGGTTVGKTITGDTGGALSPTAGNWNLLGSGSITTLGSGSTLTTQLTGLTNHCVLVGAGTSTITKLTAGTNGQVLIGSTGADPVFATLTSSDSSITFTTGAGTLSLQVTGGSTVGKTITGNSGGAISPSSGNWNLVTANSTSRIVGSGSTLTLDFNQSNFGLGSSFASLTSGTFNHGVGSGALTNITTGTSNTAMGYISGNNIRGGSANTAYGFGSVQLEQSGNNNTGIGYQALQIPNGASNNTAVGYKAGINLTTGSQNTLVGASALAGSANLASYNIAIGYLAGSNYGSSESSNIVIGNTGTVSDLNTIRIGTQGSGNGQQTKAFIAGVAGVSVSNKQLVTINSSTGQLGSDTVTARSTLTSDSTGAITWSAMTDGQVIIGSTAGSPTAAALTAGTGISITSASNSITINSVGAGLTWSVVTGASQAMAVNRGYIANNAGTVAFTLPTTSAVGDMLAVTGINNATGWSIAYTTNQQIFFGTSSATLTTGTLASTNTRDTVHLVCVVANLSWNVVSSIGSITVT